MATFLIVTLNYSYYLMPEKTEEEFTSYAHARRWFKTGDIGEFQGSFTFVCNE